MVAVNIFKLIWSSIKFQKWVPKLISKNKILEKKNYLNLKKNIAHNSTDSFSTVYVYRICSGILFCSCKYFRKVKDESTVQ